MKKLSIGLLLIVGFMLPIVNSSAHAVVIPRFDHLITKTKISSARSAISSFKSAISIIGIPTSEFMYTEMVKVSTRCNDALNRVPGTPEVLTAKSELARGVRLLSPVNGQYPVMTPKYISETQRILSIVDTALKNIIVN